MGPSTDQKVIAQPNQQQTMHPSDIDLSQNYIGHMHETRTQMAEAVAFGPGNSHTSVETSRNSKGVTVEEKQTAEQIRDKFYRMGGQGNAEGLIKDADMLRWTYNSDLSKAEFFPSRTPEEKRSLLPRPLQKRRKGKGTPGLSAPRVRTKRVRMDAEPEVAAVTERTGSEAKDPIEHLIHQLHDKVKEPVRFDGRSDEEFRGDQRDIGALKFGNSSIFRLLRRDHLTRAA